MKATNNNQCVIQCVLGTEKKITYSLVFGVILMHLTHRSIGRSNERTTIPTIDVLILYLECTPRNEYQS